MWKDVTLSVFMILFLAEHGTIATPKGERENANVVKSPVKKMIHSPETPEDVPAEPTNSPLCYLEPYLTPCDEGTEGYYYDEQMGSCMEGGCPNSGNYFKTVDECVNECGCHKNKGCYGRCKEGQFMDFYYSSIDCYLCKCHG